MPDYVETLRLEYQAEEAARKAKEMAIALAEVNTYAIAQAPAIHQAGEAIELYGETYEVLPRQIMASAAATSELAAQQEQLGVAMKKADQDAGRLGRGLLQAGYLADDAKLFFTGPDGLVQGFRAIGNNIPGLVMSLGGSAGLAGVIALVGTGAALAAPKIAEFFNSFSTTEVNLRTEEMKKLADQVERTADEQDRLNRFKREEATGKRLEEAEPKAVRESRQAAENVVIEAGFRDIQAALVSARNPQGLEGRYTQAERDRLQADKERIEAISKPGAGFSREYVAGEAREAEAKAAEIKEAARERERTQAKADISAGLNDPVRFQALMGEFQRAGGQFTDLARKLAETTPEARKAREDQKEWAVLQAAAREVEEDDRKKLADAARKATTERKAADARELELAQQGERMLGEGIKPGETAEEGRQRIAAEKARAAAAKANEAKVNRDLEADRKAVDAATRPFEAQAEMAILQGARGQFASPRARAAFQQQAAADIRRQARANLLAQGVDPDEAGVLAQRAPQQVSENLQQKNLALQAQGMGNEVQRLQALVSLLIGDMGRVEGQVHAVRGRTDGLVRERQQIHRNAQNRAR